jgi:hypothetical protein
MFEEPERTRLMREDVLGGTTRLADMAGGVPLTDRADGHHFPLTFRLHVAPDAETSLRDPQKLEDSMSSTAVHAGRIVHRRTGSSVWVPWLAGWLGATVLGVANGVARRALYEDRIGPEEAHSVSTGALVILLGGYMGWLTTRWPIPTRRTALLIGAVWAALTVGFEFGLGRFVVGDSWEKLFEQYEFWRGKAWILVPFWIAVGPALIRELRGNATGSGRG